MSEYGRTVDILIEIDVWTWSESSSAKTSTLQVTNDIQNYRFQKTIKAPQGSCQLSVLPQSADTHIMDVVKPMDVVRIYEFGTLKFIGYVTRVSYDGSIGQDGKPNRMATITCQQFGGLLSYATIGLGLGTALGIEGLPFRDAASALTTKIRNAVDEDGVTYAELFGVVYDNFRLYLSTIGASNFITYLDAYLDAESCLTSVETPLIPRTMELYTGTEQSMTFWQLVEQLVQRPFNELWIDNGPRKVWIDGESVSAPDKSCVVFRRAPFNGTVTEAGEQRYWDSVPIIDVTRDHLLRFSLARSMDEVYTFYSVKEPSFNLADNLRLIRGIPAVDTERVGKYLFRPFMSELFYTRVLNVNGDAVQLSSGQAEEVSKRASSTLYNWFKNNEDYLSGVIQMMVPSNSSDDPRIGDRVRVYGIEGTFYIEGVSHMWNYQGPLKCDLTVTRGFDRNRRIEMKDRIFVRSVIR